MRKRHRVLIFAALVAALVVPLGYALSLESAPMSDKKSHFGVVAPSAGAAVLAPIARRSDDRLPARTRTSMPDAAKLIGVGSVLFGLAAFLRKPKKGSDPTV